MELRRGRHASSAFLPSLVWWGEKSDFLSLIQLLQSTMKLWRSLGGINMIYTIWCSVLSIGHVLILASYLHGSSAGHISLDKLADWVNQLNSTCEWINRLGDVINTLLACMLQGHAVLHLPGVPLLCTGEQEGVDPSRQPTMDDQQAVQIRKAMAVHDHKGTPIWYWHHFGLLGALLNWLILH